MGELLVITACLYQKGCSDTAEVLYEQRPALQEFAKTTELKLKSAAGPLMSDYLAPMIYAGAGGTGKAILARDFTLKYNRQLILLNFEKLF